MSRTKDHHWPEDYRPPRPRPLIHALLAAWKEFRRVREQQKRRASIPDPFKEPT